MASAVRDYLNQVREAIAAVAEKEVEEIIDLVRAAHSEGRHVFLLGNGGSAATATHIAEDLQKAVKLGTGKRLKAIALTDNVSLITAWANDSDYSAVFAEQLDSLLQPHDVVIAISGSGNSPNVIRAVRLANERDTISIGLAGMGGGELARVARKALVVRSDSMPQIEDVHLVLGHLICTCLCATSANLAKDPSYISSEKI